MTDGGAPDESSSEVRVYLGLGSNIGDRAAHLAFGLRELGAHGRLTGVSGVYESAPVGYTDQPAFLNLVARLATGLGPRTLLDAALDIERRMGRLRTFANAPRTLDIDILAWEPVETTADRAEAAPGWPTVMDEPGLHVPHPRMAERAFVLVPLLELAPDLADPRTGRRYADLLSDLLEEVGGTALAGSTEDRGNVREAALETLGLRRLLPVGGPWEGEHG